VICQVADEDQMPIDEHGNRADVVFDPNSTIGRMNLGRLYEQYYNACSRDTHKRLCAMLGVVPDTKAYKALTHLETLDPALVMQGWNYLMEYYAIISPEMRNWFTPEKIQEEPISYLSQIVEKGITIYLPTNNQPESEDIVLQLEQHYRPLWGPVSYVGNSGQRVVTKDKVRIAGMYFILLEKIGDDWSAVSSGKLQHFGVLAPVTKADKYSKPYRPQPVRGAGEAEVRIYVSYVGPLFVAELMDRNNNPKTHKSIVHSLLSANQPCNIDRLIDRRVTPFGGSKPISLAHHLLSCSGFKFQYEAYKPNVAYTVRPSAV
jgi:hypothetical protein